MAPKDWWLFSALATVAGASAMASAAEIPPKNPFLADSPWAMTHGNPYNQDSSELPGPSLDQRPADAHIDKVDAEPVPITLAVSGPYLDGRRAVWGNSRTEVVKMAMSGGRLSKVARQTRGIPATTEITGAYALVDADDRYIVPRDMAIDIFRDGTPGDLDSAIVSESHDLRASLPDVADGERIVGLSMSYDGFLVFATNVGRLGVLTRDARLVTSRRLGSGDLEVSNTIALDEGGGVYVLSDRYIHKFRWDGAALRELWQVAYDSETFAAPGRLGRGSGTSPTLMGVGPDEDHLLVISDGLERMRILVVWRDDIPGDWQGLPGHDRRIAALEPVTFGKESPTQAITEQSIVVSGYGAAIVDNSYGDVGKLAERIAVRRGHDLNKATIYLSNSRDVAPYGVEKFEWNPAARRLESVWARPDISCPNGIPAVSVASDTFYCVGQRQSVWNIEALDWQTGTSRFVLPLGRNACFNSFYAGLEIGPDGTLLTGTFCGPLSVGSQ